MSSFSNILSSLGGTQQPASAASPANAPSKLRPAAPPRALFKAPQAAAAGVKRKHDEVSAPLLAESPSQLLKNPANGKSALRPANPERPHLSALAKPSTQAAQASARPATPLSAEARVPPKNSYQAILARAQAAQTKQPEFGQIKHKPVQKPARQIRSQTPEQGVKAKDPKLTGRSSVSQSAKKGRPGAAIAMAGSLGVKPKRKPLELDYKGTMRPSNTPAFRESSSRSPANAIIRPKPSATGSSMRLPERSAQRHNPNEERYRYKPDSDEEQEGDYEEDTSDSDDMGGGGFDELMEEEEASARAAMKEDAEELRYETKLKRQKAEKKKAMERFQAAQKGKSEG